MYRALGEALGHGAAVRRAGEGGREEDNILALLGASEMAAASRQACMPRSWCSNPDM